MQGFFLAHRSTRWDPYPHTDVSDIRLVRLDIINPGAAHPIYAVRSANGGWEYPVPMVPIAQAHGCMREKR